MPVRTARRLAAFMGVMTVLWSVIGLHAFPILAAIGAVLGAAIVVGAIVAARRPERAPSTSVAGERKARNIFGIAVALETVAVLVAIVVLNKTGRPEYILPAVALAVALHFFVFLIDQPDFGLHLVAGALGTIGSIAAIALMAAGTVGSGGGHAIAGGALALCTLGYGTTFLRIVMSNTTGPDRT